MQAGIRHVDELWVHWGVLAGAWVWEQCGGGVGGGVGVEREHDLPLPGHGDERGRHQLWQRRDAENAAERADGRDPGGVWDYADFGDLEREREQIGRASWRVRVGIREVAESWV